MFEQFSRNNPAYVPVFNGHGLIEGLVDELLFESVKHPNSLHENYSFAQRLNILQSVSLDLLIATTRLRNRVKRLLDKLGWEHPLSLKAFRLLHILEDAVTRDIV
jgi:hypothetical protein